MKRIYLIFIIALLFVTGCDITKLKEYGTLKVVNNSSFNVWVRIDNGPETTLYPDEYLEQTWELNSDQTIQVYLEYGVGYNHTVTTLVTVIGGFISTYDIFEAEGNLELVNMSSRNVWYEIEGGQQYTLASNETDIWGWDLLEYEQANVEVDYSGYHVFSNAVIESITGGHITRFNIIADGGGIELWNNFLYTDIYQVYLSPSDELYWGDNDLTSILHPGNFVFWTVEPGWWDIKAVDEDGFEYLSYDNYIALDETSIFYVDGWMKSVENNDIKKSKKFINIGKTEDRIELKNHK